MSSGFDRLILSSGIVFPFSGTNPLCESGRPSTYLGETGTVALERDREESRRTFTRRFELILVSRLIISQYVHDAVANPALGAP